MGRQGKRKPSTAARRPAGSRQLASQGIAVPRPRAVNAYLRQHRDLAELVPALCAEARREFGSPTELSLEVYCDPEIDDSYLSLYVRQEKYEADLLARIHRVSEAHHKDLAGASGHFLLTTDFCAPQNRHAL